MTSYRLTPPINQGFMRRPSNKVFSSGDIAKIIEEFKKLDINGDGKITREELKACLPEQTSDEMVDEMMMKIGDFNGDQVIEFQEYLAMNEWKIMLGKEYWVLFRRFQEFDSDGSGLINIEELRRLLDDKSFKSIVRSKKSRWFDTDEQTIIEEIDTNNDGKLNYGEFLELAFNFNLTKRR